MILDIKDIDSWRYGYEDGYAKAMRDAKRWIEANVYDALHETNAQLLKSFERDLMEG